MSLKRSHTSSKSAFGGGDAGAKVDRQEFFDELKRMAANNEAFTPVDVALSIGAGEPQVSKALLGLAAEGYLEKVETGKYKAVGMAELGQAEFLKAFARASRVDSTRQRDLAEIARLKQNNDTMRQRLLTAIAERDISRCAQAARHRPRSRARGGRRGGTCRVAAGRAAAVVVGLSVARSSGPRRAVTRVGLRAVRTGRPGRSRADGGRTELGAECASR